MKRTTPRGRKPRKQLLVTGIEPLPAVIEGWEIDLVRPVLGPLIVKMANDQRADQGAKTNAAP